MQWPVLSLTRSLLIDEVELKAQRRGKQAIFELRWSEAKPMRNRQVRFWPLWRPWDPVFEQSIPDTAEGTFTFDAPGDRLRSGKYRLEFLVVDPWLPQPAEKPAKGTPGTVDVELLSAERSLTYLAARIERSGLSFETLLERAFVLCHEELETGTLVAPFPDMVCKSPLGGICLLGDTEKWHTKKVEAFRLWAYESADKDRAYVSHLIEGSAR